ncbi:MAG: hypothetical protein Q8N56_04075, partial [bacterium]|nr:hypothetical protein [bacterium]
GKFIFHAQPAPQNLVSGYKQKSGGCPLFDACSIGFPDAKNFNTEPIGMQGIYFYYSHHELRSPPRMKTECNDSSRCFRAAKSGDFGLRIPMLFSS